MDGIGDFTRRGRVNGGAVDEQSFPVFWWWAKWRMKDAVEDILHVSGFGKDGYDDFL